MSSRDSVPSKICASCGRAFAWRKKWERDWESVRYCSDACRKRGVRAVDHALEDAILSLLAERSAGATICPSEAARMVDAARDDSRATSKENDEESWRELMEPARRAARRLVAAGKIVITQQGKVVDPSAFRGAIRLRLRS